MAEMAAPVQSYRFADKKTDGSSLRESTIKRRRLQSRQNSGPHEAATAQLQLLPVRRSVAPNSLARDELNELNSLGKQKVGARGLDRGLEQRIGELERNNKILMEMLMRKPPATDQLEDPPAETNKAVEVEVMPDTLMARINQEMKWRVNEDILNKHREGHRVDVEISKTEASLEQLRRCYRNPYPGYKSRATETLPRAHDLLVGSSVGYVLPQGVDATKGHGGAYVRHFQRWLIPDESSTPMTSNLDLGDANMNMGRQTRASRGGVAAELNSPSSARNLETYRGHPLVLQNSKGVWVKLTCPCAGGGHQIKNIQGFINHCRILHSKANDDPCWNFKNHKDAADFCGDPAAVEKDDIPQQESYTETKRGPKNIVPPVPYFLGNEKTVMTQTRNRKTPTTRNVLSSTRPADSPSITQTYNRGDLWTFEKKAHPLGELPSGSALLYRPVEESIRGRGASELMGPSLANNISLDQRSGNISCITKVANDGVLIGRGEASTPETASSKPKFNITHLARLMHASPVDVEALAAECNQAVHSPTFLTVSSDEHSDVQADYVFNNHTRPAVTEAMSKHEEAEKGKRPTMGVRARASGPHLGSLQKGSLRAQQDQDTIHSRSAKYGSRRLSESSEYDNAISEPPTLIDDYGTAEEDARGSDDEDVYNKTQEVESWLGNVGTADGKVQATTFGRNQRKRKKRTTTIPTITATTATARHR